jgi:hypothetical protein
MNLHRFLILGAAVGALAACSSDNTSPKLVTPQPHALIHIVNAVPDTGALDFRFTDVVDGVPNVEFVNLAFRGGTNVGYRPVSAGSHHLRVFMSASNKNANGDTNDPAIVATVLGDTTFTFVDGAHYTFIFYGNARPPAGQTTGTQKFLILTDNFTAPTSGILVRAVNLNTAAADFYVSATTTALTAVPTTTVAKFANVAPATASAYTGVASASSSSNYAMTATPAGAATPVWSTLFATGSNGVPEVTGVSGALQALPGARITGSIFTGILFSASTPGSKAVVSSGTGINTTPLVVLMPDRFCTNTAATATC